MGLHNVALWYGPRDGFAPRCANFQGRALCVKDSGTLPAVPVSGRGDVVAWMSEASPGANAIAAVHSQCISVKAVKSSAKNILGLRLRCGGF
jgi:hypothetical protein